MKTRTSPIWIPGLVLLMAWSLSGLAQNEIDRSSPFPWPATSLSPALAATNVLPKIRLSPWTTEIVKLAQVGIDDNVMLSFIDNSGMFNLGAEQIIYLSDLGISSDVISEMLRHDAEVIVGVRPLTISSEPPPIQVTFATNSSSSTKADAQPATTPAPPTSADDLSAIIPTPQPLPETSRGVTKSEAPVMEVAMVDEREPTNLQLLTQQRQSDGKRGLYRVREPYPVQLTAPILVVQSAERPPNTIVIEWFPGSDER